MEVFGYLHPIQDFYWARKPREEPGVRTYICSRLRGTSRYFVPWQGTETRNAAQKLVPNTSHRWVIQGGANRVLQISLYLNHTWHVFYNACVDSAPRKVLNQSSKSPGSTFPWTTYDGTVIPVITYKWAFLVTYLVSQYQDRVPLRRKHTLENIPIQSQGRYRLSAQFPTNKGI